MTAYDTDLTYRKSKDTLTRMAAIRLGPSRVEICCQVWDICRGNGITFLRKFQDAVRDRPKSILVHIASGPGLDEAGLKLLAWAREAAQKQGIELTYRAAHRPGEDRLESAGLSEPPRRAA